MVLKLTLDQPYAYTRRQTNQDRMIFYDFSVNFEPIFLKILQRPFSIQILTVVKISQNYI